MNPGRFTFKPDAAFRQKMHEDGWAGCVTGQIDGGYLHPGKVRVILDDEQEWVFASNEAAKYLDPQ